MNFKISFLLVKFEGSPLITSDKAFFCEDILVNSLERLSENSTLFWVRLRLSGKCREKWRGVNGRVRDWRECGRSVTCSHAKNCSPPSGRTVFHVLDRGVGAAWARNAGSARTGCIGCWSEQTPILFILAILSGSGCGRVRENWGHGRPFGPPTEPKRTADRLGIYSPLRPCGRHRKEGRGRNKHQESNLSRFVCPSRRREMSGVWPNHSPHGWVCARAKYSGGSAQPPDSDSRNAEPCGALGIVSRVLVAWI